MIETIEPAFRADFAERVLREADGILARRRGLRRSAGFVAIAVAGVTVAWWALTPWGQPRSVGPVAPSRYAQILRGVAPGRSEDPDALGALFPDAAPLAQFSARYSQAADGDDAAASADLFADEDAPAS